MPFKKGKSGNLAGRPAGSTNKKSEELRSLVSKFVENNFDDIQSTYNELEPDKKLQFFDKMLSHVLPKLTASSIDVDFNSLSDEQLNQIINAINIDENE